MQHQLGGRTVELKRAIKKEEMPAGGYGPTTGGTAAGGYSSGAGTRYGLTDTSHRVWYIDVLSLATSLFCAYCCVGRAC